MHGSMSFDTFEAAYAHLLLHKAAGHEVPEYALEELERDAKSGRTPKDDLEGFVNNESNKDSQD